MDTVSQLFHNSNSVQQMTVGYSYRVKLRTDYVNKEGKCQLVMRVTISRKHKDVPLRMHVHPLLFNDKTAQIERTDANKALWKFSDDEVTDFNLMIKNEVAKATKIFVEYRLSGRDPDLEDFIRQFTDYEKRDSFLAFFQRDLNARKDLAPHTRELHQNTINLLTEFQADIRYMHVKLEFINAWDRWLKVEKGHNHNTRVREHRDLCQYINRSGVLMLNPYDDFKWPHTTRSIVFLEQEELKEWTSYYFSKTIKATHKRSLKYFLGMCYTSIRISDAQRLKALEILDNKLVFVPHKTKNTKGQQVVIPLSDLAKKFIEDIKNSDAPEVVDQTIRGDIRDIGILLGSKKKIKPKDARHTFATVFLERGGAVEVLQEILGHSDIADTMVYVHITNERKKNQIHEAFNGFHSLPSTGLWDHILKKGSKKKKKK